MAEGKRVSELTVAELEGLIESVVRKVVRGEQAAGNGLPSSNDLVPVNTSSFEEADPDAGRQLRPKVAAYLEKSYRETKKGKRGIPMAQVAEELGLRGWQFSFQELVETVIPLLEDRRGPQVAPRRKR